MLALLTSPLTKPEVHRDNPAGRGDDHAGGRDGTPNLKAPTNVDPMIQVKDVNLKYGQKQALFNVNLDILGKRATAFIGPSGCGKTTLLRCLNRLNDLIDNVTINGTIRVHGVDIYAPQVDVSELRKRVGMVFQKSNPFPKSIYDNVAYGPRIYGIRNSRLDTIVEKSLRAAALWDEVKDRLRESGLSLSGGQQQRLCIARAISSHPALILADEPTGELDSKTGREILALLREIAALEQTAILVATHDPKVQEYASTGYMLSDGQLNRV